MAYRGFGEGPDALLAVSGQSTFQDAQVAAARGDACHLWFSLQEDNRRAGTALGRGLHLNSENTLQRESRSYRYHEEYPEPNGKAPDASERRRGIGELYRLDRRVF